MNEAKAQGIALLIKQKRELEEEVDKLRKECLLLKDPFGKDIKKFDYLINQIAYQGNVIQSIQDYLIHKTQKIDGKKKKKGFYLFGYKIF